MEQVIFDKKHELQTSLLQAGASEEEIASKLLYLENSTKFTNQWEKSTFQDYMIVTMISSLAAIFLCTAIYLFFVKKSFRKSILFLFVFLGLLPGLLRTLYLVTDTRLLMILSAMREEAYSYSETGFVYSPDVAFYLLEKQGWLHSDCSSACKQSILILACSIANDVSGLDSDRRYDVLDWVLSQKPNLNAADGSTGLTALHLAVLYNDPKLLDSLIAAGADANVRILKPGKSYDGLDVSQYAAYLDSRSENDYSEVRTILNERFPDVME